jgi:neutral/alkaline ceramidase-like enzyme
VISRALFLALLLGGVAAPAVAKAADLCAECVTAGASSVTVRVPAGTPLAGYGAAKRRLLFPDVFGRYAHAFWFKPSVGQRDPITAKALVLATPAARLAWVTLDLVGVDGTFVRAVQDRLTRSGVPPTALIVSASHTHSGPGAFMASGLIGFVAVDRLDPAVRDALVDAAASSVQQADRARGPALAGAASVTAAGLTASRVGKPLDSEIVVLKLTTPAGAPLALVWNFAIHGTMLSASNLQLSGDVTGLASARLEQKLGVPALFVNGAVGDVSPARHGEAAMVDTASALASVVEAGWAQARPAPVAALRIAERRVPMPAAAVSLQRCLGSWVPAFFVMPVGSAMPREAPLLAAALGDTAWVTIPGELQTSFGQAIKREGRAAFASVFVAGLSNDYLGYFTTREDARGAKYVACATVYGPGAGGCLTDAAIELVRGLRGESARAVSRCDS